MPEPDSMLGDSSLHVGVSTDRHLPLPSVWRPQLAVQAAAPPLGGEWLHEIKHDGYRALAFVDNGKARVLTRNGHDWTGRYGPIGPALAKLPCQNALLDGELAVADARRVTRLDALQRALVRRDLEALTFFAFDLVFLDGRDLSGLALIERKAVLARFLGRQASHRIQITGHESDGTALFARACELGMEGIVSKRADAPYQQARSASWVKVKPTESARFTIIGYLSNQPACVSSLILAEEIRGELVYRCRAAAGLDLPTRRTLYSVLQQGRQAKPAIAAPQLSRAHWTQPAWTVELAYSGRTAAHRPRAPVVLGSRECLPSALPIKLSGADVPLRMPPTGHGHCTPMMSCQRYSLSST